MSVHHPLIRRFPLLLPLGQISLHQGLRRKQSGREEEQHCQRSHQPGRHTFTSPFFFPNGSLHRPFHFRRRHLFPVLCLWNTVSRRGRRSTPLSSCISRPCSYRRLGRYGFSIARTAAIVNLGRWYFCFHRSHRTARLGNSQGAFRLFVPIRPVRRSTGCLYFGHCILLPHERLSAISRAYSCFTML